MGIEAGVGLVPPATGGQENPASVESGQSATAVAGGEGSVAREWVKDLSEPLKTSKTLAKFTDDSWKENLAKSYVELEGKLGKAIFPPTEGASEEERAKYLAKLGRPEKPEDYSILPGTLDKEFEGVLRAKAHAQGLTKAQLTGVIDAITDSAKKATQANEASAKAARESAEAQRLANLESLRRDLGTDFERRMNESEKAVRSLFPANLAERMKATGILDDPEFRKAMSVVGGQMGETGLVLGKPTPKSTEPYDWMYAEYGKRKQ